MSKGEVTANARNIYELLKTLPDSDINDRCDVLNYIYSNITILEKLPSHKEEHIGELCKVLIDYISGNTDNNRLMEICDNLMTYLFETKYKNLNFFQKLLEIDKKRRLMIFLYLEMCQDSILKMIVAYDPEIAHFLNECMRSVNETTMPWLKVTDNEGKEKSEKEQLEVLTNSERAVFPEEKEREEKLVHYSMSLLERILTINMTSPDIQAQKFNSLVLDKIVTLAYLGHKRQRTTAMKVLKQVLLNSMSPSMQKSEIWKTYKENLRTKYCVRMKALVSSTDLDWTQQWIYSVKLLGPDLSKDVGTCNKLLIVEEKAFKSSDPNVRLHAFICWNSLIDYFTVDARNQPMAKRIKVICIPLNANNSKIESISLKKLEVWWHLINFVYKDISTFATEILVPFLGFCFGPLGDTPLMSIKMQISCPSPGKRFNKTKAASIDALLQLLAFDRTIFKNRPLILDERLPMCISQVTFSSHYKTFIHSVIEAIYILEHMTEESIEYRKQTASLLWINLVKHVNGVPNKIRSSAYMELLTAVVELSHFVSSKPLIKAVIMDTILTSFEKNIDLLVFSDNVLTDLAFVFINNLDLKQMNESQFEALSNVLHTTVISKTLKVYNLKTMEIFSQCVSKLESEAKSKASTEMVSKIWCIVAKLATHYMEDSQKINEGTSLEHNFRTIRSIVVFPFVHLVLSESSENFLKTVRTWRSLFQCYFTETELVVTVKKNEIMTDLVGTIHDNMKKEIGRFVFIAHCLGVIVHRIDYTSFYPSNKVAQIVKITNEVTTQSFKTKQCSAADASLKALNLLLIEINNQKDIHIQAYLKTLKPAVTSFLTIKIESVMDKEIANTWEKVVNLMLNLSDLFDVNFLKEYRDTIVIASKHQNDDVVSHTYKLMSIEKLNATVKEMLSKIWSEAQVVIAAREDVAKETDKGEKKIKIIGSFLNRKVDSPVTIKKVTRNQQPVTKIKPKPSALPPDPDSQDFVVINSDFNYDVKRLTEHQKEKLKHRGSDIPALFNDQSQSGSQDSNHLQHWFEQHKTKEMVCEVAKPQEHVEPIENEDSQESVIAPSQEESCKKKSNNEEKASELRRSVKRKAQAIEEQPPAQRKRSNDGGSSESTTTSREMRRLTIDMLFDDQKRVRRKPKSQEDYVLDSKRTRRSLNKEYPPVEIKKRGGRRTMPAIAISDEPKDSPQKETNVEKDTTEVSGQEQRQNTQTDISDKSESSTDDNNDVAAIEAPSSEPVVQAQQSPRKVSPKKTALTDSKFKTELESCVTRLRPRSPANLLRPVSPAIASPVKDQVIADSQPIVVKPVEAEEAERKSISPAGGRRGRPRKAKKKVEAIANADDKANQTASIVEGTQQDALELSQPCLEFVDETTEEKEEKQPAAQNTLVAKSPVNSRTARMLNLISKTAVVQIEKSMISKIETGPKKDRASNLKEPEKIGSPSSRQEKMFRNMQADITFSDKTFSNLKNNGEKVSPKMNDNGKNDNGNLSFVDDEIPFLEWSSTNPPSLSASPSMSILKRICQSMGDLRNAETDNNTSLKYKRVSFADPPVSKQMRYEVTPNRSSFRRQSTPLKLRQTKLRFTPSELTGPSTEAPKDFSSVNHCPEERLMDMDEPEPLDEAALTSDMFASEKPEEKVADVEVPIESQADMFAETTEIAVNQPDNVDETLSNTVRIEDLENKNIINDSTKELDDTMAVANVMTGLNSHDSQRMMRCSTTVSTIPATASIFASSGFSIDSQDTRPIEPTISDPSNPIYPSLMTCEEPIETIIQMLTNTLWVDHLRSVLNQKQINSIGHLASLTADEVNRLPIKGSCKITYLRKVLTKFESEMLTDKFNGTESLEQVRQNGTEQVDQTGVIPMQCTITDLESTVKEYIQNCSDSEAELLTRMLMNRLGRKRTWNLFGELL